MLRTLERKISMILLAAIIILAGIGIYGFYSSYETRDALKWEEHTRSVIEKLDDTVIAVVDAESSVRGFAVYNGRDEYLEPYDSAKQKAFVQIAELKSLIVKGKDKNIADEQLARVNTFEVQTRETFDYLGNSIVLQRSGGLPAVVNTLGSSNRGKDLMTSLRQTAAEIQNEEQRLLDRRVTELDVRVNRTFFIILISVVIGMLMLALAEYTVLREIGKRQNAEEKLREANKSLEKRVEERTRALEAANKELREIGEEREKILMSEQTARREAEIASSQRDEFMAVVSHELRTPMNAILGWARLIKQGKVDDEKMMAKAIETIIRNSETQNRLIEDLLDTARIVSGKLRLEKVEISPEDVVQSAFSAVKPAADAKSILVNLNLDENDGDGRKISGDPNRLQQVFSNLLTNAVKFTPEGGRIDVDLTSENNHVEIKIADSGVGINPEFLPFVFERFRQEETKKIRRSDGLGLGLAIVRYLTEMHDGTVSVESDGENQGAVFTVKLPISESENLVRRADV